MFSELIYPRTIPIGSRTEEGVPRPPQASISDYEEVRIRTPDGEKLHAYFIRPSNKRASINVTVLMFHGNAGNIGHRLPIAHVFEEFLGCHVLMVEYRGYGLSTGTPDEKGLKIDSQAGLDWIRQREEIKKSSIIVFGQSIGGAVAVQLVARNQKKSEIAGLVLENTFLSIRKMIPRYEDILCSPSNQLVANNENSAFPPAKYLAPLCHQVWPSEDTLPQITDVPILFISGLKDEIVP